MIETPPCCKVIGFIRPVEGFGSEGVLVVRPRRNEDRIG